MKTKKEIEDEFWERLKEFSDEEIIKFNKWQIDQWLKDNEYKNSND